jgi:hypothetical protein
MFSMNVVRALLIARNSRRAVLNSHLCVVAKNLRNLASVEMAPFSVRGGSIFQE